MSMENIEKKEEITIPKINEETMINIKSQIDKVTDTNLLEKLVQDNQLEFELEGIKYRVTTPNYDQKQEANQKRLAKYMELLRNPVLVMEKELRQLYKTKGIDIDEMDKQLSALNKKKESYMYKIGEGLKEKKAESELKIYKTEIENINKLIQELIITKTTLLEYSIEHQIMIYVYSYLTYLIAEKKVDDKWVSVWLSYEQFMQDKTALVNKITFYSSLLISNELNLT